MTYKQFIQDYKVILTGLKLYDQFGDVINSLTFEVINKKDNSQDTYCYDRYRVVEPFQGNMENVEMICRHLSHYIETKLYKNYFSTFE